MLDNIKKIIHVNELIEGFRVWFAASFEHTRQQGAVEQRRQVDRILAFVVQERGREGDR